MLGTSCFSTECRVRSTKYFVQCTDYSGEPDWWPPKRPLYNELGWHERTNDASTRWTNSCGAFLFLISLTLRLLFIHVVGSINRFMALPSCSSLANMSLEAWTLLHAGTVGTVRRDDRNALGLLWSISSSFLLHPDTVDSMGMVCFEDVYSLFTMEYCTCHHETRTLDHSRLQGCMH